MRSWWLRKFGIVSNGGELRKRKNRLVRERIPRPDKSREAVPYRRIFTSTREVPRLRAPSARRMREESSVEK